MSLPRDAIRLLAGAALAVVLADPARATGQVAGPVQIGPAWGQGDPSRSSAQLAAMISNYGGMADRLIRVNCPAIGQVALTNGSLHPDIQEPTTDQQRAELAREQDPNVPHPQQNGLDLPPALHGQPQTVTARFDLTHATQPVTDGALVPCAIYFARAGERIVVFSIGEPPHVTEEP